MDMLRRTVRVLLARSVAALILFGTLSSQSALAQVFRPVEDGPIHEAFVPSVSGISGLEAISQPPPSDVIEKPPASCHPEAIWIKGYWSYDEDSDDFQWVGGCWRRPPRGQHWIDGFWHQVDEGWVWIRGFWSPVPTSELVFIEDPPPDPFEEDSPNPPGAGYFWLAGYWGYQPGQGYVRYFGRWMEMDRRFVLVPASYTWRPEGYVFLAAYWDWNIDDRGCTYQTVYVEPAARVTQVVYEPVVVVQPSVVLGWCYSYYPNYVYFVHHHYHHHHDWWYANYDVPTWWGWNGWWSMSWHDHWGVWWWWSNPGYPHPHFMTAAYAARIAPPVQKNVFKVKNVYAPKIVTVNGVVTPKETLKAAKKDKSKGIITPVIGAKTKDRLRDNKGDSKDNDDKKRNKNDRVIAKAGTLVPSGTKSAKDEQDDPKKQPPKPTKKQSPVVKSPGVVGGGSTTLGTGKANDDERGRGKGNSPPITSKGRPGDFDKTKGKNDEKSNKSAGKSTPPIMPPGETNKNRDQGKVKGKGDRDDNRDRESDKRNDDRRDRPKDRPVDAGSGKKGTSGAGSTGTSDAKPKTQGGGDRGGDKPDRNDKTSKEKKKDKEKDKDNE
jgi:hypothetical protein